ncbi:hypothetical protein TNCV_1983211 [Trichonephila clavipes]|nr:hypothetical protein TNCV_1983211 [Trichonephila clavipes]
MFFFNQECSVGSLDQVQFDVQGEWNAQRENCNFPSKTVYSSLMSGAKQYLSDSEGGLLKAHLRPTLRYCFSTTIYRKDAPVNSTHCCVPSHMGTVNYLNEKECRPVVKKLYSGRCPQCQSNGAIYSPPFGIRVTQWI